ncbi:hypothetical protein KYI13_12790 (plasmid) [Macrococcoides bohemicum]|uniref:hypothetical protein n=1 Tax=Macrococcoides bohemicum TaxID=1903056 RepID=UPI001C5D81D2|nr:hypothetical protein [Macrococcus bohemicus]QYA46058.1 hypothetical protein KYI13_12790 [Macrococcus bohemicus]
MQNWDNKRKSQNAIKEFIEYHGNHSKCTVLILENNKTVFKDVMDIFARVETNYTYVEINFNDPEDKEFYSKYQNNYQVFSYSKNTLHIEAENKNKNNISIYIS